MTIRAADLLAALRARWMVVAVITALLFALVAALAFTQPRQYLA